MNKKYSSLVSAVILTLVLAGAGCNSSTSVDESTSKPQNQVDVTIPEGEGKIKIEMDQTQTENNKKQAEPVVYESQLREFTITAKNWEFSTDTIIVNQGDRVKIKITSVDVTHSFILKDYNINVKLEPNKTKTIEFVADKFGVFPFRCGVPCGEGHREMTGNLVVK
ncbi:MAG: hypothetical protein A2537_00860 [Candidatus Magasanikbacteria bacterium RIFOXYD2_FULL_36_9]|uniref:Cytochrome oxidase subunit II copper A binding domain-containing protein n=1 Tax=Candidatus Magasanikbacteria bacterium RIFOXYD2_FULL_36_9 TaxID=1798707 RepID=A0A1F6NWT1_9BACT|nr:MAG: hypothetical protein A2537_00860 [Candidatus Magasanikbacteria bacterium RIFOXYD2_FULL_36_9]